MECKLHYLIADVPVSMLQWAFIFVQCAHEWMEARGVWGVPALEKEFWVSERVILHSGCSDERRRERSFCLLMADTDGTAPAESADTDGTAPAESALPGSNSC